MNAPGRLLACAGRPDSSAGGERGDVNAELKEQRALALKCIAWLTTWKPDDLYVQGPPEDGVAVDLREHMSDEAKIEFATARRLGAVESLRGDAARFARAFAAAEAAESLEREVARGRRNKAFADMVRGMQLYEAAAVAAAKLGLPCNDLRRAMELLRGLADGYVKRGHFGLPSDEASKACGRADWEVRQLLEATKEAESAGESISRVLLKAHKEGRVMTADEVSMAAECHIRTVQRSKAWRAYPHKIGRPSGYRLEGGDVEGVHIDKDDRRE